MCDACIANADKRLKKGLIALELVSDTPRNDLFHILLADELKRCPMDNVPCPDTPGITNPACISCYAQAGSTVCAGERVLRRYV